MGISYNISCRECDYDRVRVFISLTNMFILYNFFFHYLYQLKISDIGFTFSLQIFICESKSIK